MQQQQQQQPWKCNQSQILISFLICCAYLIAFTLALLLLLLFALTNLPDLPRMLLSSLVLLHASNMQPILGKDGGGKCFLSHPQSATSAVASPAVCCCCCWCCFIIIIIIIMKMPQRRQRRRRRVRCTHKNCFDSAQRSNCKLFRVAAQRRLQEGKKRRGRGLCLNVMAAQWRQKQFHALPAAAANRELCLWQNQKQNRKKK